MGTRVYPIGGGNPGSSGNQNFAQLIASLIQNDSSVSGANVKAALDALLTGDTALAALIAANTGSINANTAAIAANSSAITGIGSYPYIAPPAVANAFDDEFSSGSPDLGVRGYTVINASTGVVQTRNGNIDVWGSPPAGSYNSQLLNSWLFVQAPAGIQLDVYKGITLAAGDTYAARMTGSYNLAPAANGRFNEVGLFGTSGAQLDNNNRVYATVRDDTTANYLQFDSGRITGGGAFTGAGGKAALGGHDVRGIYVPSATNASLFYIDSQNNEVKGNTVAGTAALATLNRFAIRNLFSTSGSNVPQVWAIDYIRKKTANAWLIP